MQTVLCDHCATSMQRYPSLVKPRNFCNRRCQGAWRSAHMTATRAANWQRGSRQSNGYVEVYAPWAACASARGYAPLHRLVMEIVLRRPLDAGEVVHHRDGDTTNNRPDNLIVMSQSEHIGIHRDDLRREVMGHAV